MRSIDPIFGKNSRPNNDLVKIKYRYNLFMVFPTNEQVISGYFQSPKHRVSEDHALPINIPCYNYYGDNVTAEANMQQNHWFRYSSACSAAEAIAPLCPPPPCPSPTDWTAVGPAGTL